MNIDNPVLTRVIQEQGTPLYYYDKEVIKRQLDLLHQGKPDNLEIFYAVKGNSNLSILKFFNAQQIGVEIASGGELYLAQQAGFTKDRIIYTGPAKTDKELEEALGINAIHIESLHEGIRLNSICEKRQMRQKVLVRINALFEVKTKVQLSGCPSPFGISEEEIMEVLPRILSLPHLDFEGIHVYNASGILDYQLLLQNVKNVFELVQKLEQQLNVQIPIIDFGGGLGIDYSDKNQHVDTKAFYIGMQQLIDQYHFGNRQLIMEIARFLVAESGCYITQIIDKKYSRGEVFLITDGGIQHFMRVALFGDNHSMKVIATQPTTTREIVNVTGSLCTSIDVMAKKVCLPKVEIGDFLIIEKAGCYGLNAGINHFLSHEMPVEILANNQEYEVIRSRGNYKDLLLNMPEG